MAAILYLSTQHLLTFILKKLKCIQGGVLMKTQIVVECRVYFIAREAVFSLPPVCSSKLQQGVQLPVSATQGESTLITELTGGWGGGGI